MLPEDDKDWEQERIEAEVRDRDEETRIEQARADARAEDEVKLAYLASADVAEYPRDEYFVESYTGAPLFQRREEAIAEVQSAEFLCFTLQPVQGRSSQTPIGGLEYILADKHATAGLRKELVARNIAVIRALKSYAKARDKGGPLPIKERKVVELTESKVRNKAIARMAGTSVESVRSMKSKARKKGLLPPLP